MFRVIPYNQAHLLLHSGPGVAIWTDFDRLGRRALGQTAQLQSLLQHLAHLNHPFRSEMRFALLQRLHRAVRGLTGLRFGAPMSRWMGLHYPVFLRDEVGASKAAPHSVARLRFAGIGHCGIACIGYRQSYCCRISAPSHMTTASTENTAHTGWGSGFMRQHCFASRDWFSKAGRRD